MQLCQKLWLILQGRAVGYAADEVAVVRNSSPTCSEIELWGDK